MKQLPFVDKTKFSFFDSYLIEFEARFKTKFPTELIEFLKIQNGGTLEDVWFLDKYYVNNFFPLYNDSYGTISQMFEFLISEEVEDMIPFAGDNDSLTFCYGIKEKSFGKIFGYQSCDWIPNQSPLFQICDTFEEFINSFKNEG